MRHGIDKIRPNLIRSHFNPSARVRQHQRRRYRRLPHATVRSRDDQHLHRDPPSPSSLSPPPRSSSSVATDALLARLSPLSPHDRARRRLTSRVSFIPARIHSCVCISFIPFIPRSDREIGRSGRSGPRVLAHGPGRVRSMVRNTTLSKECMIDDPIRTRCFPYRTIDRSDDPSPPPLVGFRRRPRGRRARETVARLSRGRCARRRCSRGRPRR